MFPRRVLPWFLVLLAAGLTACTAGSSSFDPAPSTTTPTPQTTAAPTTSTTTTTTLPGTGVALAAGRVDDPTGWFPAAVTVQLVEALGYEVSAPSQQQLPAFAAYPALAQGDVDFWATSRLPEDLAWEEAEIEPGVSIASQVEHVGTLSEGGIVRGFVVNRALAEDLAIASLSDIDAQEDLAALFDREGDGAADVSGCAFDTPCAAIIDALIADAGWQRVTQTRGGYGALVNDAEARVADGEPVILYLESPSAYSARLAPGVSTLWLSLATFDDDNLLPDSAPVDSCTSDPCWTGFAAGDLGVVANAETLREHPALAALLELIEIPVEDIATAALQVDRGLDSDDAVAGLAARWISDNGDLTGAWLDAARAAG